MKWDRYFSAEVTLSHSSSHLQHSLSLLTQEQARTLRAREGMDWRRDWRKGEEGGKHQQQLMDTLHPFNPLHGELKKNHPYFLDFPPKDLINSLWCKIGSFLLVVVPSYVSKFKKFLSSSIIQKLHGLSFDPPFGMFARKSSYEVKSWMDGEVGMEKVWIFKFWLLKLSNLRASISWFYLHILISLSLILNL